MTDLRTLVERMARESDIPIDSFGFGGRPVACLHRFAALVAAECCSIVHGQCDSDNAAQRTVDAIRERFGITPSR